MKGFKVAVAVVIVVLIGRTAAAQNSWKGRKVITKFGTVLKIGNRVVDDEEWTTNPSGSQRRDARVYRVEHVSGPWLWLVEENGSARGWAASGQVVPFEKAIDYCTEEIRANPTSEAYSARAAEWNHREEYDIAIGDCNEAIRLDPRNEVAYQNRGVAWENKKEFDKAIADYSEAIRLDPPFASAYFGRGLSWHAKKKHDKAIADYDEAIRLDPNDALKYSSRGAAWAEKKDYDKAIADFDEAIRLDPMSFLTYYNRAVTWSDKGDYDRATADYSETIRRDSKFAWAFVGRGWVWFQEKDYGKALKDYSEAVRLDSENAMAVYSRGRTWKAVKEYDKAIADYEETIQIDPNHVDAYNGRAWIWATCPDPTFRDGQKAVESATLACGLSGWKKAHHIGTLAAAYAETGVYSKAIGYQTMADKLYTDAEDRKMGVKRLKLYMEGKPYRETR